jgi:ABC-type nitrate/sulfonate/bicarbonate transport system substrate-binding protein
MNRRRLLHATASAAALGWSARPGAVRAQARQLTIGFTSRSSTDWPLYCASKVGFYAANNLQVDEVVIGSSAGCAQQLTAGSIDIGSVSATQVVEAVMGGAPLVEIVVEVTTPPYSVLARKGITSVAALRGKTTIIGGPSDITRVFMDKVITGSGLRPEDFTYTFAGASSDRFAALISGAVDAAILLPPFTFRAIDEGFAVVADVQKFIPHFPFGGLAVRSAWAKAHPDIVTAFDKSYIQGARWLYDPANRTRACQILAEITNSKIEDALRTYDQYVGHLQLFSKTGRFAREDFTQVIDTLIKTKQINPPAPAPESLFDNRYADAALGQLRR